MKLKINKFIKNFVCAIFVFAPAMLPLFPVLLILFLAIFPPDGENFKAFSYVFGESQIKTIDKLAMQLKILGNTVLMGFLTVTWATIFSIPAAFNVFKLPSKINKIFRAILILPLLLPPYVLARAFMDLSAPDSVFSQFYQIFTGNSFNYNNIFVPSFILGIWLFPVMFMFMLEGLRRFDNRFTESTQMFAGKMFTFRKVALPLLMPAYLSGAILVFILAINNFGVPALFNITTLPSAIFVTFDNYIDWRRFAVTAIQGIPLIIILIPAFFLLFRSETKANRFLISGQKRNIETEKTLLTILLRSLVPTLIIGLSVVLPVYMLANRITGFFIFKKAFVNAGGDLLRSFLIAVSAGLIAVLFWGTWAIILAKHKSKLSIVLLSIALIPLAFPRVLVGLGIIKMFGFNVFVLIMSYVIIFMPFAVRAAYNSVQEIHPSLSEILATTGMNKFKIFFRLYYPLTLQPLVGAGLLIAVFVFGEVVIGQLISPPGFTLVSLRIYNLIHYSATEYVAALSIILMLITSTLYLIYLIFFEGEIKKL